jgi:hypothetical protein
VPLCRERRRHAGSDRRGRTRRGPDHGLLPLDRRHGRGRAAAQARREDASTLQEGPLLRGARSRRRRAAHRSRLLVACSPPFLGSGRVQASSRDRGDATNRRDLRRRGPPGQAAPLRASPAAADARPPPGRGLFYLGSAPAAGPARARASGVRRCPRPRGSAARRRA